MTGYDDGDYCPERSDLTDYQEWCEAQDALELEAWRSEPADYDLCPSGMHPAGGSCRCGEYDQDIPF